MHSTRQPCDDGSRDTPISVANGAVLVGEIRRAGWRPVARGLYLPESEMSTVAQRTHAWRCLLGDGLVVTGLTAAAIRRWWLPALPLEVPVFIAISEDDPRPRRVGLRVARHRASIPTTRLDGLDVAIPAETMLASARHLSLLDLIILGDSALHSGDCTEQDLRAAAGQRRRGARALRRALPFLDSRSESSGETLLRLLHISCAIRVEPQFVIKKNDRTLARADLRIVGTRRLPEYDGAYHRDPAQYERDRRRDGRLRALGWEPYSYSIASVLGEPVRILRDADGALGRDHRLQRIKQFYELLNPSSYTKRGAAQLHARLGVLDRPA